MEQSKNLYEQIYEGIKDDILSGRLTHGQRLPSKRACAECGVRVSELSAFYHNAQSAPRGRYVVSYAAADETALAEKYER